MRAAIIGAGPAGLMAAKKLAQEGNSPIVFEKHDEVGIPVRCGEVLFDPYNFFEKDPPGSRVKIG